MRWIRERVFSDAWGFRVVSDEEGGLVDKQCLFDDGYRSQDLRHDSLRRLAVPAFMTGLFNQCSE